MNYQEAVDFLFNRFPVFEKTGGSAYKPGLKGIEALCAYFDEPQHKFRSVHIAGTNGKGSSSHLIASVMQAAGYKTGLYTSPHLKSFTERIKINGIEITEHEIVSFVNTHRLYFESVSASFFEITTVMAFEYFAHHQVDIAIIETGLGGRFDSTNVINPELSLITNISFDHMQYLGNTLREIAGEKAGIIKNSTPVVLSETQDEILDVFITEAALRNTVITRAEALYELRNCQFEKGTMRCDVFRGNVLIFSKLDCALGGFYQEKNIKGVLTSLDLLRHAGWKISDEHIREGFLNVLSVTGLKGRWQLWQDSPRVICDTAHNEAGIKYIVSQLKTLSFQNLYVVLGMVKDKDINTILHLLPKDAWYIFCMPDIPRALDASELHRRAQEAGLKGETGGSVKNALDIALQKASAGDLIFIGGSTFVVAEIV